MNDLITTFGQDLASLPAQVQWRAAHAANQLIGYTMEIVGDLGENLSARVKSNTETLKLDLDKKRHQQLIRHQLSTIAVKQAEIDGLHPSLIDPMLYSFSSDIVTSYKNNVDVLMIALNTLGKKEFHKSDDNQAAIGTDSDWFSRLKREAGSKSGTWYKETFGRILAGELTTPGSFSEATLLTISRLSPHTAESFAHCCNLSGNYGAIGIATLGMPIAPHSLPQFGVTYNTYTQLQEDGLLRLASAESIEPTTVNPGAVIHIEIGGQLFNFKQMDWSNGPYVLKIPGIFFSKVGSEIRSVLDLTPVDEYMKVLLNNFKNIGLEVT